MVIRRGAFGACVAAGLIFSAALLAQDDRSQNRNQAQNQPKLSNAQKAELAAIHQLIDAVAAGQPAPNDLSLTWLREDLLKAQGGKQYVPFTMTIDPAAASGKTLTVYWRVVSKTAAPPPPSAPPATDRDKRNQPAPRPADFAYEDMNTHTLASSMTVQVPPTVTTRSTTTTTGNTSTTTATTTLGPSTETRSVNAARISRAFAVPGGSYDVYVVVKEPAPEKRQRNAPPQKVSLIKQSVDIPDLWNDELNTSSVLVTERIDPLPAPLTPQEMTERPYALGAMEVVPRFDTKFKKTDELSTFLLIYNTKTDAANKPDVNVEFNFYAKEADAEKFFNKTNPQSLNAQTLPPQFDFAAGHQLQAGQAVPLASFPEGDYRLEIKVTDKLANKMITRNVNFSVSAS